MLLPAPVGSHDGHDLPRLDLQLDVLQDGPRRVVGEGDALVADVPAQRRRRLRVGPHGDGRALVEHLQQALHAHHHLGELRPQARERVQRPLDVAHVLDEDDERAGAQRAGRDAVGAVADHGREPDRADHAHRPRVARLQPGDGDARVHHLARLLLEALQRRALAAERLDDPDGGDRLLREGGHVPLLRADALLLVADPAAVVGRRDGDERAPDDGDQREAPVDPQHDPEHAPELEDAREAVDQQLVRDQLLHLGHVVRHPCDEVARALAVVEGERQPLDVAEQRAPQAEGDAEARRGEVVLLDVAEQPGEHGDRDHRAGDGRDQPGGEVGLRAAGLADAQDVVDEERQRPWLEQAEQRAGDDGQQRGDEAAPVRAHEGVEHAHGALAQALARLARLRHTAPAATAVSNSERQNAALGCSSSVSPSTSLSCLTKECSAWRAQWKGRLARNARSGTASV